MDLTRSLENLVRLTSEMAQESARLETRAREAMSQAAAIIDRSRQLLSLCPVSGTPALPTLERDEKKGTSPEASPVHQTQAPPAPGGAALERIAEQNFTRETVSLDGRHFVDCKLEACILEYFGGPVILEGTHFTGCRFRFGGEAAMTVSMLECFGQIEEQHAESARLPLRPTGTARVN